MDFIINKYDENNFFQYKLFKDSFINLNGCYVKDLSKLNRELNKIISIDNSLIFSMLQPYNLINISSWKGD